MAAYGELVSDVIDFLKIIENKLMYINKRKDCNVAPPDYDEILCLFKNIDKEINNLRRG